MSRSDVELASSWSQQDKARVTQLLVNLQELLGCGAGTHFVFSAQLITQGLHFTEQFLWAGSKLGPMPHLGTSTGDWHGSAVDTAYGGQVGWSLGLLAL